MNKTKLTVERDMNLRRPDKPIRDVSAQCIVGHLSKVTGDKQDTLLVISRICRALKYREIRPDLTIEKHLIFHNFLSPTDENMSDVSLEEIQHWNVRALKDFLRIRGLNKRVTSAAHSTGLHTNTITSWLCSSPKSRRQDNLAHVQSQ